MEVSSHANGQITFPGILLGISVALMQTPLMAQPAPTDASPSAWQGLNGLGKDFAETVQSTTQADCSVDEMLNMIINDDLAGARDLAATAAEDFDLAADQLGQLIEGGPYTDMQIPSAMTGLAYATGLFAEPPTKVNQILIALHTRVLTAQAAANRLAQNDSRPEDVIVLTRASTDAILLIALLAEALAATA